MMPAIFYDYDQLHRDGVILYFSGPVSQDVVEGFAELIFRRMCSEETGRPVARRIFALLVEQMQNIVRYSCERAAPEAGGAGIAHGQVVVGRETDGRFFVASGNRIRAEEAVRLSESISQLRAMDPPDLKAYYRERRRSGPDQSSQGAGLGFIEMARQAARPLDFTIVPVDQDTSFFSLKAVA